MKAPRPVTCLRWTLALVIGHASGLLLWSALRGAALHAGIHPAITAALASVELLAAILLLIPRALALGARLLWGVLLAAALLHLHTGQTPPPTFLVYAAGIWVVAADARRPAVAPT